MKIICIGRNYAEHAKEMKAEVPTVPVFFLKPDTALFIEGDFYYPSFSNDINFECELVIKIDKVGKCIDQKFTPKYYSSFTLGIDFTARDLQAECKKKSLPWEISKGFDQSAYLSKKWLRFADIIWEDVEFEFLQNGIQKQNSSPKEMIFNIDQIISYVSKFITLKTGDLIYTGTPAGVGPVKIGDFLEGKINGTSLFSLHIK